MEIKTSNLRKGNTLDIIQQTSVVNNTSMYGTSMDMYRSLQQQKQKLTTSGIFLQRIEDNIIEQRGSYNELGQEKRKQEMIDQEESEENNYILSEKYHMDHRLQYHQQNGFSSKTIKLKEFKHAQGSRELDFYNTVFTVLPSMEHKYQNQLLHQFVLPESKMQHGNQDLSKRKQKIQSLQQNIDGEFNANTQLFNKLKGTPVLFTTSSFHLVHKASLKYLSVDETNQDSINSKVIHNRSPYIFTDYSGQTGINKIDVLSDESSYGKIYANLETQCKWKINLFQESETDNQKYTMNVGDSIWLNLSEHHYTISAIKSANIHQKIKNNVYSANEPLNNGSEIHINRNQNRQRSIISPINNTFQNNFSQPPTYNNIGGGNQQSIQLIQNLENTYQNQQSLQGKQYAKQVTHGQEYLSPNYAKGLTLLAEEPSNLLTSGGSKVSKQLSNNSNSRDLDDEDDYDENLDINIGNLENEIFQTQDVDFIPSNAEEQSNFVKKDEQNKLKTANSGYRDEGFLNGENINQKEDTLIEDDDEEDNQSDHSKNQNVNTQGLWKVESEYFVIGGILEWRQNYRLRHFVTGKYLTLEKYQNNDQYYMRLTRKPNSLSLFKFEGLQQQIDLQKQRYITKDNFFRLKHVQSDRYIGLDPRKITDQNKCVLQVSKQSNQHNIYKMKKANFDDTWETNFLLCCVPILTESIKFINKCSKKSYLEKYLKSRQAFEQIFSKIQQVLKDMDLFVCNTLISNISVTDEYAKPSLARQNILREQHVLGILCLLLFKSFPKDDSLKNLNAEQIQEKIVQENQRNFYQSYLTNQGLLSDQGGGFKKSSGKIMEEVMLKKFSVCIQIYKIFQNVCYDNKQNQEYIFKFMTEFQKQIGSQDIVCESLIRFFKQNRIIIQRLSLPFKQRRQQKKLSRVGGAIGQLQQNVSEIHKLGSHLSTGEEKHTHLNLIINKLLQYNSQKKSDILKLLTQFCKYNDQAIFNNQETIFNNLIMNNINNKQSPLFILNLQGGDNLTILIQNNVNQIQKKPSKIERIFFQTPSLFIILFKFQKQYEEKLLPISEFLQLEVKADDKDDNDIIAEEDFDPTSQDRLKEEHYVEQYKQADSKDNNYLMNQLNLYANLCLNRNYNSCNFFQDIFPLKTLIDHVDNELIKDEYIKASFLKLIHYIYLDKEPRTIQVKPNYIRVIDQEFDQIGNEIFNLERKRMASIVQKEPHQSGIEMQPLQIMQQSSKLNKMSQHNQEAISQLQQLEGKELLTGISEHDSLELKSLKKLKTDLLEFMLQKEEFLKKVTSDTQNKIFNVMTLETVKVLKMMLKFGIFNSELETPVERFKKKTVSTFIPSKLMNAFKQKEEPKPKTEIEKLVDICVKILEYDQFYQETLQQLQIIRRTEEIKKQKDNPLNFKLLSGGMDLIGQGFGGVKDLFDFALGGGGKDSKKAENNKKKQINPIEIAGEIVTDPLFKKVQGLKKVLNKYTNKTYMSKSEMKKDQEQDYETEIKIQICQIFQELLNIQQDFYLDNTISYFKKNLVNIRQKNSQFKIQLCSILPIEPLEVGTEYSDYSDFVNYTDKEPPKTFDTILERSFMETLLISFYFAENSVLSNEIMNLIRRFCKQKHELISNVQKIELLLTPESKRSYKVLSLQVSRLKNLIQNSQIWLQITSNNKESDNKMNQILIVIEELIAELAVGSNQNSEEYEIQFQLNQIYNSCQQMKTAQSIFKHIGGEEAILQLLERAYILFHSKKEVFYSNNVSKNQKVSDIIQMVNSCHEVLVLFCKNNPVHQEYFFHRIFKQLAQFKDFNFGQIPLLYEIIKDNFQICSQLKIEDLKVIADFIVVHGKYSRFLHFFEIILQAISKKDNKQSKIIQALVMKILFEDRIAQRINPYFECDIEVRNEDQYRFYNEEPDIKNYRDQLIRLMSKGLSKDIELSVISKMNKVVKVDNLLQELYNAQTESIQYERSKEKQHLTPNSYKMQRKILKILLFYFTKSQKEYIDGQLRGNKIVLQFIQLVTDRLKEEKLYPLQFQITLLDRVLPLINIYSELFLKELNISLTESQDYLAQTKMQFSQFASEYIRQADQFNREYEQIFTKDIRFKHLLKLSTFYSIPIPKSLGGLKNFQNEGKLPINDTELGYLEARGQQSHFESNSSLNTKRTNNYQQSKLNGSVGDKSKQILDNEEDYMSFVGEDKQKRKQSMFSQSKKNSDKGSPQYLNSPRTNMRFDAESIHLNSYSPGKNLLAEDNGDGMERTNSNRMSNNKLIQFSKNNTLFKKDDQSINQLIEEGWVYIKDLLNNESEVQELLQEEKSNLSNNILNVQNIFMANIKENQKDILLNPEDLLIKCLNYIEFWHTNHSEKEDIIFTIKSLSNLLNLDESEEEIQNERQCMLDKLNATKICLLLISDDSAETDNDLLYFLIKFIILILDGGNLKVQKTIYDFFISSSYGEKFFSKMNNMINDQILQETSGQQYIFGQKGDKIVEKILRLLQLFCEGHNNDLQTYMRNQINNKKSYDFVTQVTKLLSTYKIHNQNFDTVIQCFDTLTEFIQGPCKENQICILSSKFLEYAVLVLSGEKKIMDIEQILIQREEEEEEKNLKTAGSQSNQKKNKSEKNDSVKEKSSKQINPQKSSKYELKDEVQQNANEGEFKDEVIMQNEKEEEAKTLTLHSGKLARLKHKCLITIVSLLECNINSQDFVTKIMRTIPLNVLTDNLSRIYELYQKYEKDYIEDVFNRADQDIDPQKPEEYSELIIENGFNLYILVNLFLENKKSIDQDDDEIQEFIDEFAKEEEEDSILKNNIFFDLTKVGTQFIGLGLGALKDIYKKATNQQDLQMMEEQNKKIEKMEKRKNAIKFFKKQVGRVEIVRDGQLQFIYFPILPFCKMMPEEVNMDFRENVKRTSTKTKLSALMGRSYYMIKVMKHEERLRIIFGQYKVLGFFAHNIRKWEKISFFVACILNIIVLFSYSEFYVTSQQKKSKSDYNRGRLFDPRLFYIENQTETEEYIITLGIINIVFYSIVVLVFLLKKAPILIGDIWEQYYQLYKSKETKKQKKKKGQEGIHLQLVGGLTTLAFGLINKILQFVVNALKSVLIMLQDYEIVYYSFNMAIVIFGLTVHPFLFVGCLSDLLRNKHLKNVVEAMWKPKSEILLLLVLFMIFQYYITLFAYIYFNDHFNTGKCETLWRCFVTVFDLTFKQNGGVGASMRDPQSISQYEKDNEGANIDDVWRGTLEKFTKIYFLRFGFDNLTNIILLFILINILKGIIVDKFRSLKDEVQFKEFDEKYFCFTCGISREILDKAQEKKGFSYHIRQEHYMWNYVYYRAYLEFKECTEYNGDESYVRNKIDESDLSWFPVKRTWSVQQKEDQELQNLQDSVIENQKDVNDRLKDTQLKFLSAIEQVTNLQAEIDNMYESQYTP